ncbi:hypothetical protein EDF78_103328 [Rahnella sp. BIGb0236]|uniref:hypothetical protein n=1 Tax=Rahnella sp. BIGb0236 TaxID=2485117 RepID=UPI00105D24FE|nr:hypothetical protein [Rahnella sp. BIGb0236]TDS95860.1 hypothetical protein EDF78_103328 [Rahnella sp. BIGb0236]
MWKKFMMRSYLLAFLIFLLMAYVFSIYIGPENYYFVFIPIFVSSILFWLTKNHYKKVKALNDLILCSVAALAAMAKALNWLKTENKPIHFLFDAISFDVNLVTFFIFLLTLKGIIAFYEFRHTS